MQIRANKTIEILARQAREHFWLTVTSRTTEAPTATSSRHANADLADVRTTGEILKRSNNLIPPRPKLLLHRNRQPPGHNEPRDLLQVLPRANHDAPHDRALREGQRRDVGHLVLGARREEPDDGDAAAVRERGYALGDGPRAAVLEDEVGAVAVCEP